MRPGKPVTARHREQASRALKEWHRKVRPHLPKCGAHARSTGEPCRKLAMANGRCIYHGGRTPKGDAWHRPRWFKGSKVGNDKLERKLADRQRADRKRAVRLAAMTPEERERHDAWHRAHKPGPPGPRAARRRERRQAVEIADIINRASGAAPGPDELQNEIDRLRAIRDARTRPDIFS